MKKVYLGDSVYASFDGYQIWLTTENGFDASNSIALDDQVLQALINYKERLENENRIQSNNNEN